MDPWTPEQRNSFVEFAINSEDNRGQRGPYHFSTFPKVNGNEVEDTRRSLVTEALAKTIYQKNPSYRKISLAFYDTLFHKLSMNPYTGPYMGNDVILLMKGGNAYAYVTQEQFPAEFPFSDLDIVVYINPYIEKESFDEIEKAVRITVLQTLSQYKRLLDHMFFVNRQIEGRLLDEETVESFKFDFQEALNSIDMPDGVSVISPFESDEVRNFCSRNSFLIANKKENSVVRVEVPHFDRCERIPLRKTPLFCSYNKTIDFVRDNVSLQGHFDLYRIRMNTLFVEKDTEGNVIKEERVPADFIDVSIASKNDAELIDFWNKGRCLSIYDRAANVWLMTPDIQSCISDLYKMLFVYECPEGKKQKRQQKYARLTDIAATAHI
jgi:hypothetical protein